QGFAHTHNVGTDVGMVTSKQFAGTAEAGGNFISDQEYIVLAAQFPYPAQIMRGVKAHAAGILRNRLENNRSDFLPMLLNKVGEIKETFFVPFFIEFT